MTTNLPDETDVLVVGAGPVGLTVAIGLRLRGVDVTLIDDQAAGANTSRAAVVHPRTVEVLDGLGVAGALGDRALHLREFSVRDRDRVLLPLSFGALPTPFPEILMVPQSTTEQVLLDRLTELGGQVLRPHRVGDIRQDPEGVTATIDGVDGADAVGASATRRPHHIRARYLVGADGLHSTVRERAGIGFSADRGGESLTLADVTVTGGLPEDEVVIYFSKAGMLVSAPLPDGTVRIVAEVDEAPADPDTGHLQQLLDERGPQAERAVVTDVVWGSRFLVHHRVADTFRSGRFLLAGDAAHVHSPAGGQGMNLGIRDAASLAGALAAALGGAGDAPLASYADSRRPRAQAVVSLARRITPLATTGPWLRPVRNLLLQAAGGVPTARSRLAARLAGLDDR
jgi:2-polyprenyl-6-methoxyphenol hydroxylase-like FAD-dependent oxidoreductase